MPRKFRRDSARNTCAKDPGCFPNLCKENGKLATWPCPEPQRPPLPAWHGPCTFFGVESTNGRRMKLNLSKSYLSLLGATLFSAFAVGCETVEGVGEDIEEAGEEIEDAADDAR